ncbi:MAG TPA: complex I NDUFA9 subunit family protein [Xanthobacteraceae bacterium]|jgi:NADH dehydrogenase
MVTQSDLDKLVTVFGGSGFLGRHVVRALCKRGYRVRVAVRRPDLAGHLQPLGRVGQIHAVAANLRYPGSVEAATRDADIVVNLVGILFEGGRQRFDSVHTFGAEAVALAAAAFGARLIHISALGADPDAPSHYARSKAMGEKLALAAMPSATILRPSILFGPEDNFFNKFAALARIAPALPLIGGGLTRFQPVFAGDVASAVLAAIDRPQTGGAIYELGGLEVTSFKALMEFTLATIERRRLLVSIPFGLARTMAYFLQLPGALGLPPMLTQDQVELLRGDNVVSAEANAAGSTLAGLGIEPVSFRAVVPSYLWRFRKSGQFKTTEVAR